MRRDDAPAGAGDPGHDLRLPPDLARSCALELQVRGREVGPEGGDDDPPVTRCGYEPTLARKARIASWP
jgi:hypothetical protein